MLEVGQDVMEGIGIKIVLLKIMLPGVNGGSGEGRGVIKDVGSKTPEKSNFFKSCAVRDATLTLYVPKEEEENHFTISQERRKRIMVSWCYWCKESCYNTNDIFFCTANLLHS